MGHPILNKEALFAACQKSAACILGDGPQPPQRLAERLYDIALDHDEYVTKRGMDPNLITRSIRYLNDKHENGLKDEERWEFALDILIELACPNAGAQHLDPAFFHDIQKGIQEELDD